ncbi:unnamed protein product [Mytilus coruscus]|uniref:Uncharacterized protein n=1 Tax=Mytilus coruscus TaxID=42192 RepID=A0A6J8DMP3_MYTCO|nr:unnamed protein product [Mytilus coruscus]
MMAFISPEEENYVRLSLLLTGISRRAARNYFDSEFSPACLYASMKKEYNKLFALKKKRTINPSQWKLMFPQKPETTPGADLARIKHYRNYITHLDDGKVETADFNTAWDNISGVARIKDTLKEWKTNDDEMFIKTRAAQHVLKCIKENSTVTITASSGVGKTYILRHVALQMAQLEYDIIPVTDLGDIVKFNNPNKKILIVVDDLCGNFSVDQSDIRSWEPLKEDLNKIILNEETKLIAACRLQVFKDEKFQFLSVFQSCVCDLL